MKTIRIKVLFSWILVMMLIGCGDQEAAVDPQDLDESRAGHEEILADRSPQSRMDSLFAQHAERFAPIRVDRQTADRWVTETLAAMTLEQKIGQLFIVDLPRQDARRLVRDRALEAVERHHVGGFLVPRIMDPDDVLTVTTRLQRASAVPLFFAADYERGVGRHVNPLTEVPSNMAIGATRDTVYAAAAGRISAIESRATGVNFLFAPVVDVNNNPANPIINIRSYGEDPFLVGSMGARLRLRGGTVRDADDGEALSRARQYIGRFARAPGHDPRRPGLAERYRTGPVPACLRMPNPPAAVMTAHLWIQAIDERPLPATLSSRVLRDLLRTEMGYDGLVVTDDVKMGALQNDYPLAERVVRPIEAGSDIILTPENLVAGIEAVQNALRRGRLTEARIDESVRRILRAKAYAGLHENAVGSRADLDYLFEAHRGAYLAQQIADDAITVLQSHPALPVRDDQRVALIQISNFRGSPAIQAGKERFAEVLAPRGFHHRYIKDEEPSDVEIARVLEGTANADIVVVALYQRLVSGRGDAGLFPRQTRLVRRLLEQGRPVVLVTFGNPYAVTTFRTANAFVVAYDQLIESNDAAARVLRGALEPRGRLPITVDPFAFGAGVSSITP
jgi:beta-N-acetylhexosaminidase